MAAAVDQPDRPARADAAARPGSRAPASGPYARPGNGGAGRDQPVEWTFAATLRRFRLRTGRSQNALGRVVALDASYIHRLESGERDTPTRQVVDALARALALTPEERDTLLFAAGYVPPSLQKLGPHDSTVAVVLRLLTDDRLSPAARGDFRAVVETIAARWQHPRQISTA